MPVTALIGGKPTFLNMINGAGASADLDFCLDAAALASYDGSAQTWVDLTGNGNSFFRGATSGAEASDPTFNGVAGDRSENEFFSVDGGDHFVESAAHTFAEPWHKDNAVWTVAGVFYVPTSSIGTAIPIFSNRTLVGNGVTFAIFGSGSNFFTTMNVWSGGNSLSQNNDFGAGLFDQPIFAAIAVDESVGAGGITWQWNATRATDSSSYFFVDTGPSAAVYQIASQDTAFKAPASSRYYCMAGWSRRLSNAELDAIYLRLQRRYSALP